MKNKFATALTTEEITNRLEGFLQMKEVKEAFALAKVWRHRREEEGDRQLRDLLVG